MSKPCFIAITPRSRSLQVAFAALKKDGSVVTWGGHYLDLELTGSSKPLGRKGDNGGSRGSRAYIRAMIVDKIVDKIADKIG